MGLARGMQWQQNGTSDYLVPVGNRIPSHHTLRCVPMELRAAQCRCRCYLRAWRSPSPAASPRSFSVHVWWWAAGDLLLSSNTGSGGQWECDVAHDVRGVEHPFGAAHGITRTPRFFHCHTLSMLSANPITAIASPPPTTSSKRRTPAELKERCRRCHGPVGGKRGQTQLLSRGSGI